MTAAFMTVSLWSYNDNDSYEPALGIISTTLTPKGNAIAYNATVDQQTGEISNSDDPITWDVPDDAITKVNVKAIPTLGCTAYYGDIPFTDAGIDMDLTTPATITVRNRSGASRSYHISAVRNNEAGQDESLVLKSTSFIGFPEGLIDYDITVFKGRFVATTVSLDGEQENYQLFESEDGTHWSEINIICNGDRPFVVGGEGARMAVLNDRLIVFGGARTKGKDKYGNEPEVGEGWFGPAPEIRAFRVYSSADGVTFNDDTDDIVYTNTTGNVVSSMQLAGSYYEAMSIDGRLIIKSCYAPSFGMMQVKSGFIETSDGINWTSITPVCDDNSPLVSIKASSVFNFQGKIWMAGGFRNFISASMMVSKIFSSSDGISWNYEGDLTGNLEGLMGATIVANDEAALLFGGQLVTAGGNTLNGKIYRTTDGVVWEEIESNPRYQGRRSPVIAKKDDIAWIFGGYKDLTKGNYGVPDGDEYYLDTWVKKID